MVSIGPKSDLPFCVARGSRRIGAARHQDDRLDACVERRGEGGGLHAHAVADDPEPLRRDAVFLHEQVEPADEILDVADHQLARHRRQRLPGSYLGLLRAAERRVDREHGDTALGEDRRLVDEVDPGAAGAVHEDDAGATFDPPLRDDDDSGDAVAAGTRVRHPLDHDVLLLRRLPFGRVERRLAVELEEPRGLLRDRLVLLRAGVAAAAGAEEEQQQDQRRELGAHCLRRADQRSVQRGWLRLREDGDRVPLRLEHDLGHVAEILAVDLERLRLARSGSRSGRDRGRRSRRARAPDPRPRTAYAAKRGQDLACTSRGATRSSPPSKLASGVSRSGIGPAYV